jgi:hypothetical protein
MLRSFPVKVTVAAVAAALTVAPSASAHNAGHVIRPDGTCQEVGSFKQVLAGPDKTPLDLMPESQGGMFDEVGTSYAAFQGNTPVQPGPCRLG